MEKFSYLSCFLMALYLPVVFCQGQEEIDLTGDSWMVADTGGRAKVPATVPGQVHLDLMKAKFIGDPYYGWNDWLLQWIAYSNWIYTRDFELPVVKGRSVYLRIEGLDTVASINVDRNTVGTAKNMHRTHYFDITNFLQSGTKHSISVFLNSSANYSVEMYNQYPYNLTGGGEPKAILRDDLGAGLYINNSKQNFVRKTQSDFGWDWGPAFVPSGITRNIMIIMTKGVFVTSITPKGYFINGLYGVNVTICTMVESKVGSVLLSINYTLSTPEIGLYEDSYTLYPSSEEVCVWTHTEVDPKKIEPDYVWWPNGVKWGSSTPSVSKAIVSVNLTKTTDNIVLWKTAVRKNIGFRRIDMVQDPVKNGLTFYFQLSTQDTKYPIFAKGSNLVPMDAFVNRATPETTRRLLMSAVEGNQNMIRVWGGGLYQPDWFYDLCDELGLMVWQEFMFASNLYPRDKDFLKEVELEVRDVIRRLSNHPSIILWSGNNENQAIALKDPISLIDYSALYDSVVRATLWQEDTTRFFWPSSPSNGFLVDDSERRLFIQRWGNSKSSDYGDTHRYDYTSFCTDVSKFPTPRFASEFGFQSYPSFASLSKISTQVDWSNDSPFMNHRQHHPNGNKQIEAQMNMFFNPPNNTDKTVQFQDFVYLSQVVQGLCIRAEAEHYRRYISEPDVLTRGTLYWQLNDIWQAQTWASLEYSGQWKILHYYLRDAFKQLSVSSLAEDNGVGIYVIVDASGKDVKYDLTVQVMSWKGDTMHTFSKPGLTAKGFTGERVWFMSTSDIFSGTSVEEAFLYYTVSGDGASSSGWFFPANLTKVTLEPATITVSNVTMATPAKVTFTLSSDAVAPFVYLESRNIPGKFRDNGFLAMKGAQYSMSFESWEQIDVKSFSGGLKIRSLQDTYSGKPF